MSKKWFTSIIWLTDARNIEIKDKFSKTLATYKIYRDAKYGRDSFQGCHNECNHLSFLEANISVMAIVLLYHAGNYKPDIND